MPSTNPSTSPTTGTTKNPITPRTPPARRVRVGIPPDLRSRPGTAYFTTVPTARTPRAATATAQATGSPTATAQTTSVPAISSVPGRRGTTIPTSPTAIANPASRSVASTVVTLPHGAHTSAHRKREAPASPGPRSGRQASTDASVV